MSGNPPDSPWWSATKDMRNRPRIALTLSRDERQKLEQLAALWCISLSGAVSRMIVEAYNSAFKESTK